MSRSAKVPNAALPARTVTSDGGCSFFVRPSLNALQATIYWSPEVDTGSVVMTRLPPFLAGEDNLHADLEMAEPRQDRLGTHTTHGAGSRRYFHVVRLSGTQPDTPLAALIPLDPSGLDRVEAVARLLRTLLNRPVPRDGRLTDQQRRRIRRMLQAVDGHMEGATYREIAEVIYGVERIRSEHWKTSALRDSVIGLVRGGLSMIAGGYRQLLRHRRRK